MPVVMKGGYILVKPGGEAFKVASNFTNYVELGVRGGADYHLEARIENGEFLINAALFDPSSKGFCHIVNNFPQKSDCRKEMTPHGYLIFASTGELLLGIEARDNVCFLRGTIYDVKGEVIAKDTGDDFLVYRGPVILGREDGSFGVVLD